MEVLEKIGSKEAKEALAELAAASDGEVSQRAKEVLKRLVEPRP